MGNTKIQIRVLGLSWEGGFLIKDIIVKLKFRKIVGQHIVRALMTLIDIAVGKTIGKIKW